MDGGGLGAKIKAKVESLVNAEVNAKVSAKVSAQTAISECHPSTNHVAIARKARKGAGQKPGGQDTSQD